MKKNVRIVVFLVTLTAVLAGVGVNSVRAEGQPWSIFGPANFQVEDIDRGTTATGSDLYTNLTSEGVHLKISETTHSICVLQRGNENIYPAGQEVEVIGATKEDQFRVIDQAFWLSLPMEDGAYSLCWERKKIFLPIIQK